MRSLLRGRLRIVKSILYFARDDQFFTILVKVQIFVLEPLARSDLRVKCIPGINCEKMPRVLWGAVRLSHKTPDFAKQLFPRSNARIISLEFR